MAWQTGPLPVDDNVPLVENSENSKNSKNLKNKRSNSQRGKMARDKGQRGEREIVKIFVLAMQEVETHLLWQLGHYVNLSNDVKRNTMQSDRGGFDLHGIPLLAPEVKWREDKGINAWWQQCCSQAKAHDFPCLFYRSNHQSWRVRSYASLQFPSKLQSMHWIVADYDIDQFVAWYKSAYREYLLMDIARRGEVSTNVIAQVASLH